MMYEINHIWTAETKWKWRNDRRSERNLCNCAKKPEKNSGLQRGLNPWRRNTGAMLYQLSYEATDVRGRSILSLEHMNPQLTCSQPQWLHSSVGRASHRYCEVTGSNPVEVVNFFSGFLTQLHKLRSLRRSFLHFRNCCSCLSSLISSELYLIYSSFIYKYNNL